MDSANERAELPPNPDVIEHEDGTIEYRDMIIKPVAPLKLPDPKKITPNTHKDIEDDVETDRVYRELLAEYLLERATDELPDNPNYIRDRVDYLSQALGKNISREDIPKKSLQYIEEFNKSWSFNKVTDAHVQFYRPLKVLQDRIRDLEEKANRWSAERYEIAEYIWRGTNEDELISLVDGSWPTSKAGPHGDQDYRSVSTNLYVARYYAKLKYNSEFRIVLKTPKVILGKKGYLISSEYVCDAAETAVKGNEARTEKKLVDELGLEEHFLLKDIDIDNIKKDITVGVVGVIDEKRFEEFKTKYGDQFADIISIPEEGEIQW